MKVGLFGGTFDPIHFGHLRAALEIADILQLERIVFIPAASPPHKTDVAITPFVHRVRMVELAVRDNPRFGVSDVEGRRDGKSYSIETVRHFLKTRHRPDDLFFITGQDAFDLITTWRDWETLLSLCHFAVMTRPGYDHRGLDRILPPEIAASYQRDDLHDRLVSTHGTCLYFRRITFLDISASAIRAAVGAEKSIRYLTPDAVIHYIDAQRLYRSTPPAITV